ncbi:hypothetical protein KCP71_19675 [Salmonella enterica subsp. enterica]|nr:hypothetical protein KCP71_19675 [Salmonella enterica subsp. enterica]
MGVHRAEGLIHQQYRRSAARARSRQYAVAVPLTSPFDMMQKFLWHPAPPHVHHFGALQACSALCPNPTCAAITVIFSSIVILETGRPLDNIPTHCGVALPYPYRWYSRR